MAVFILDLKGGDSNGASNLSLSGFDSANDGRTGLSEREDRKVGGTIESYSWNVKEDENDKKRIR